MTTASHLAEDRKGWKWSGQRKKDNKEEVKELREWRRIKIAAKDSKWTQGGECPCESYAALHSPHPSHWILGKTECFSVFGSLKKISQRCEQFHNLHSTRLLLQAQKRANMRTNSLFQGGNHNTNGCIDRHLSRKESGMYKMVILKVIVNVGGLWVRNPFRIQSVRSRLFNTPHRMHSKLLEKKFLRVERQLPFALLTGAHIALTGQNHHL